MVWPMSTVFNCSSGGDYCRVLFDSYLDINLQACVVDDPERGQNKGAGNFPRLCLS